MNGSEIGSWGGMDSDEGREEDNEGERRGDEEINPGNRAKRKKKRRRDGDESDEREEGNKCKV